MLPATIISVSASDEWSKLWSIIVGRATHSSFPSEPQHMIQVTMPDEHHRHFHSPPRPTNPFPVGLLAQADSELDNVDEILMSHGVQVHLSEVVGFQKVGGYTAAMARDGLMTVGNTMIEACFAWQSKKHEIEFSFFCILDKLVAEGARIVRASRLAKDTIYDGKLNNGVNGREAETGHVSRTTAQTITQRQMNTATVLMMITNEPSTTAVQRPTVQTSCVVKQHSSGNWATLQTWSGSNTFVLRCRRVITWNFWTSTIHTQCTLTPQFCLCATGSLYSTLSESWSMNYGGTRFFAAGSWCLTYTSRSMSAVWNCTWRVHESRLMCSASMKTQSLPKKKRLSL